MPFRLKGCVESELDLVTSTSLLERYLFLSSNIGYWAFFIFVFVDWFGKNTLTNEVNVFDVCNECNLFYVLSSLTVALISTLMHTFQLNLLPNIVSFLSIFKRFGYCSCYDVKLQKSLKKSDRRCAIISCLFYFYVMIEVA